MEFLETVQVCSFVDVGRCLLYNHVPFLQPLVVIKLDSRLLVVNISCILPAAVQRVAMVISHGVGHGIA